MTTPATGTPEEPDLQVIESEDNPVAAPSRRSLLLGLMIGTVGGTTAGTAALHWSSRRTGVKPGESIRMSGGTDEFSARANALDVWQATPDIAQARLRARYSDLGALSGDQYNAMENLLIPHRGTIDLVVIDPEYLPAMVSKNQVIRLDHTSAAALRGQGCFDSLVDRCQVDGELSAVPLNADVPVLVVDTSLLAAGDRNLVTALAKQTTAKDFWLAAYRLSQRSTGGPGTKRLLIQSGNNESLTVCLVELIHAFNGNVGTNPDLSSAANHQALHNLRAAFPPAFFAASPDTEQEPATKATMAAHGAVVGRLWPAFTRDLTAGQVTSSAEYAGNRYQLIPIPGGVLGGQVLAVAADSHSKAGAQKLATYLSQPLSQLQLFSAGNYVPTLKQIHDVAYVRAGLSGVKDHIDTAVRRPSLPGYFDWSAQFRQSVSAYLRGQTDDIDGTIVKPLSAFHA